MPSDDVGASSFASGLTCRTGAMPLDDAVLLEPFDYLCQQPGKNIRSQLIEGFNRWLRVPDDKLGVIKQVVEMLHNASLLIDDIEDNSKLRRGVPVAHAIYGVPLTINCANFVYFIALEKVLALGDDRAVRVCAEELVNLHRGQGMDLYWRDTNTCPTEDDYVQMINYKTGGLLRLAVKMMQVFSESTQDFVPLVNTLGIHFQVRDDYINLQSSEYMKNKGFCEDLTEGKFSYPIIHSIRATPNDHRLLNILKQKTADHGILEYAVTCIRKTGSFEATVRFLQQVEQRAREEIARLGPNEHVTRILDGLTAAYRPPEPSAATAATQ